MEYSVTTEPHLLLGFSLSDIFHQIDSKGPTLESEANISILLICQSLQSKTYSRGKFSLIFETREVLHTLILVPE